MSPTAARSVSAAASAAAAAVEEASLALVEMTLSGLAKAKDVSTLQLRMLLVVDRHSPLNLSALAEHLDLSVPSASRLVDRMVEAGLVRRSTAEHSRREVALGLTLRGRRALEALRRERREAITQVLQQMAATDRDALVAGLASFATAADEAGS